ncbi:MAG: DUF481 domain-containing protein, partial [Desulfamplus sp.]|nr:DUF481 domain-containing protein [Desulfamplus sp.]
MGKALLRRAVFWMTIMVFVCWVPGTFAQDKPADDNEQTQGQEKKEQDLSNWWTRNPLTFDPMPANLLKHFELTYQWDRSTGNWTSDNHMLNSQLSLRYKRFTNNLRYTFDKRSVAKPMRPPNADKNVSLRKSTKNEIHEDLRYAITKRIYAAPGMFYLEDDYAYIDERYTYYLGAGAEVIQHPLFKLSLFGAYGYETLSYIDDYHETYLLIQDWGKTNEISHYDPGTEEYDVFYLNQMIRMFPYYGVMVTQSSTYVVNASDTDIYRW